MTRPKALFALGLTLALVPALVLAQFAPQSAGSEPLSPELEARVQLLGKEIRCANCQGMSIADSPASMARSQLDMVRTLVAEGRTDDEVKAFFVERFGEWVLLRPPANPSTAILWLGPVVLFLAGMAFVAWFTLRSSAAPAAAEASQLAEPAAQSADVASASAVAPGASADDEDPYLSAVRAELKR